MNKAKQLGISLLTLGTIASTQAQQVLKRITDDTNATTVELFVLRNGTSLPNTTGEENFNIGTSSAAGNVIAYNPAIANTYTKQQLPSGTTSHSTEQVGNGTFPFAGNQTNTLNNTNFIANGGSGATLDLTIQQEDGNADSTQDMNTLSDMMYSKFRLPKALNDGSNIPNGLIVLCISRSGTDINTGSNSNPTKRIGFQRNQATLSWLPIAVAPNGSALDNLQEIGADGQLGINDIKSPTPQFKIYPNPARESFSLDDGDNILDTYEVEIYDTLGRKVGNGNVQEGENIDISHLSNGSYFVRGKSEDSVTTKTLIKK